MDNREEVRIVRRIIQELLDDFAYGHQNPLAKGCPPAKTECVDIETSEEIQRAVKRRCVSEGVAFEV